MSKIGIRRQGHTINLPRAKSSKGEVHDGVAMQLTTTVLGTVLAMCPLTEAVDDVAADWPEHTEAAASDHKHPCCSGLPGLLPCVLMS